MCLCNQREAMPRRFRGARAAVMARRRGRARPRRFRGRGKIATLSRGPRQSVGFPPMLRVKLRYVEPFTSITSTIGALAEHRLRANSIFDPDATDVGHQPKYRDQLYAIYKKAVVLRSKVVVKAVPEASNSPGVFGIAHDDNASSALTAISRCEHRGSQWKMLGANTDQVVRLKAYYNAAKHFGKNPLSNVNLIHETGADPTTIHSWIIFWQTLDGTSDLMRISIVMEFDVVFFDHVEISTS